MGRGKWPGRILAIYITVSFMYIHTVGSWYVPDLLKMKSTLNYLILYAIYLEWRISFGFHQASK